MERPWIFLDDGGVMNDNARRSSAWQRLVGEFLSSRLGGSKAEWAEANRVITTGRWEVMAQQLAGRTDLQYAAWRRDYLLEWLRLMCQQLGRPVPPDERALAICHEATNFVTPRVDSAFPGAVAAIRTLVAQGYTLHTASGEDSIELHGYLTGMNVRDCFGHLYGPDLIGTLKVGPAYYERLLADCGRPATQALFVDDSPLVLSWARGLGARTLLVGAGGADDGQPGISSLAELPAFLEQQPWAAV